MKPFIKYERIATPPVWNDTRQEYDYNFYCAKCDLCGDAEVARMEEGVSFEVFHQQIMIHLLEHLVDKQGAGSIVG